MRPTGNQTSSHSLDSAEIQTGPKAHRVHAIATPLISKLLHGTDSIYSLSRKNGHYALGSLGFPALLGRGPGQVEGFRCGQLTDVVNE